MSDALAFSIDGNTVAASASDSVAAALMNSHGFTTRTSVSGEPRGPVCGMGVCFECRVTINGVPHQRSCQSPCQPEMKIGIENKVFYLSDNSPKLRREKSYSVVVIGSGPAGLAAACIAAEAGERVAIVDDNPHPGGQIWRCDPRKPATGPAATWLSRLQNLPIEWLPQTTILGTLDAKTLLAETPQGPVALGWGRLILACGARETYVPFPGWTLPGMFGAGGLQALVKGGYRVAGRKIIIAGSGPLLLPVAAYLRKRGADVRFIAEQAPRANLMRFAGSLFWRQPGKTLEAFGLGWQILGIPYRTGCWPLRALGDDRVTSVEWTDGTRTWTEPCDAMACGFGLVPNLELAALLGCTLANSTVTVDAYQQTSIANIFAVGELTGIGGVDKALLEGQIAGWAAAEQSERALPLLRSRDRAVSFVELLAESFALREELKHLADAKTIICRCEDVRLSALQKHANWRDAKLQTRCGMGPCQGRMCGPIVRHLFSWDNDSIRPPAFPTALVNLCG